jgi:hypothetical protein
MAISAAAEPTTVFTWGVAQMERILADGIVFTVHYTINANDGTYSSGAYGSVGLEHLKATSSLTPTSRRKSLSAGRNPSSAVTKRLPKSKPHCRHKLISSVPLQRVMACRGRKSQNRHRSTATPAG